MNEIFTKLQNGSDIRGVATDGVENEPITLTADIAFKIGSAFALWLSQKTKKNCSELKVGIGRDSRISGPVLAESVAKGLLSKGVNVVFCGMATTPSLFMSIVFEKTQFDGSAMITASHLPFNKNGIKFFDSDGGLEHDDISWILNCAACENSLDTFNTDISSCPTFDLISEYSLYLRNIVCSALHASEEEKPLSGLKIIVDAGNGAAGFFVEKILTPLGANTSGSQFLTPDGMFPNHIPNPENKEAMNALKTASIKSDADLGLIFDTDVDRMSAVLPGGKEVNRDAIIALTAAILEPEYPRSTIVTDSVTSDRLTYFLEEVLHLKHLRYMRGYKNVINKQKELNASGEVCPLAMETSGHGALKENYYLDDGAYLAVKMIIALANAKKQGKNLDCLIEALPPLVEEGEYRFKITENNFAEYGKGVLEEFASRAKSKGYVLAHSYEGVRLSFTDEKVKGWILLRMSLHDPVMPMNIEGARKGDLQKLVQIASDLMSGFPHLDISCLNA
ncbi:MAG: phosphomannomutase/phosphoglucomutase [Treponemataceae bacterium]|nr:phosphomannomutase/phosphoglucomutase [Treponemataceae bacterium]